ncbi:SDR family oxidoreductase [Vulcanococcus limneticus]|uniref:SDR family oxidoreductase n=1 Tax=Vulcanococcus limneticus TaxID=2170428 RepID=UPI00398BCBF2
MRVAVSGASGKTGWRVVQEALAQGHDVRAILRPDSNVPEGLAGAELVRLDLGDREALEAALRGCDALVIATGARPSVDLAAPLKVDAFGVRSQIAACQAVGLRRVVLVSSLLAGAWLHPLNLFGLILVWKRLGERWLEQSGLDWTVVRPGGLREQEDDLAAQVVRYGPADSQREGSIPRRLVARVCLEALATPASIGRIVEITSTADAEAAAASALSTWLASLS